jgi:nicotinamide mononucleotide transporter
VDLVAIPVYVLRELYFVAALYGLFLVLATSGLVSWVRAWRRQSRIAA